MKELIKQFKEADLMEKVFVISIFYIMIILSVAILYMIS